VSGASALKFAYNVVYFKAARAVVAVSGAAGAVC